MVFDSIWVISSSAQVRYPDKAAIADSLITNQQNIISRMKRDKMQAKKKSKEIPMYQSGLSELEFLEDGWIDEMSKVHGFVGIHKLKELKERGISQGGKSEYGFKLDFDGEVYEAYYSDPRSADVIIEYLKREGLILEIGVPFKLRYKRHQLEKGGASISD